MLLVFLTFMFRRRRIEQPVVLPVAGLLLEISWSTSAHGVGVEGAAVVLAGRQALRRHGAAEDFRFRLVRGSQGDDPFASRPIHTEIPAGERAVIIVAVHVPDGTPLLERGPTRDGAGLLLDSGQRGHQDCHQQSDNGDDDKQLDQGESSAFAHGEAPEYKGIQFSAARVLARQPTVSPVLSTAFHRSCDETSVNGRAPQCNN
jgi:hypothetical protein